MAVTTTPSGARIFYDERGDGSALLLIAGRMSTRRSWELQVPTFARHYRTLTIDNRDAGESDPATADYTLSDLAADCVALLDTLGIARAHVVGRSMGSAIAARLVVNYPERVDRLILACGGLFGRSATGDPPPSIARDTWIDDPIARRRQRADLTAAPGFFAAHPEALERLIEQDRGNRITYEGVMRQMRSIADFPTRDQLAAIAAPTLALHGDRDQLIPLERGRELAASIPGARLLVFPGVGHSPQLECTAEFDRAILAFLAGEAVGTPVAAGA